jgi:hypothetical protein
MTLIPGTVTITSEFGDSTVTVIPGPVRVVSVGAQGPQGPPGPEGPAGSGSTINAVCGTSIAAGIAVCLVDGLLFPADPTNVNVNGLYVGVSTESGTESSTIAVAQLGLVTTTSLTAGSRYFVGLLGNLSTSPIASGANWMRYVGTAQSPTELVLVSSVSVVLD